jgi:hypothetical protein
MTTIRVPGQTAEHAVSIMDYDSPLGYLYFDTNGQHYASAADIDSSTLSFSATANKW